MFDFSEKRERNLHLSVSSPSFAFPRKDILDYILHLRLQSSRELGGITSFNCKCLFLFDTLEGILSSLLAH